MIVEKNNRQVLILSEKGTFLGNHEVNRKIKFDKHPYLPEYKVTFELGEGNGDAAGLKFVRDSFAYVFNETPCIMLRSLVPKEMKAVKAFAVNIPTEIYGETDKYWMFRCSIQYWMNNSVGYDTSKAEKKRIKK